MKRKDYKRWIWSKTSKQDEIVSVIIELKEILGMSEEEVIKTALKKLYKDMKKGIDIWQ